MPLSRSIFVIPLILFGLNAIISEVIGGWTKKYTSPAAWTMGLPDMRGKVAIVTGANAGIGYITALELAKAGAHVVVASRSSAKGQEAVRKIKEATTTSETEANVQFIPLDLSSFRSIENFAKQFQALGKDLHLLVLNAGIMKSPGRQWVGQELFYGFGTTSEGFENHIGINHIGHAYLTNLLMSNLKDTSAKQPQDDGSRYGVRIISVSSLAEMGAPESGMLFEDWMPADGAMPESYEDGRMYGQSKLANCMYAAKLAEVLEGTGVSVYSLHPGVIASKLGDDLGAEMSRQAAEQGIVAEVVSKIFGSCFASTMMDVPTGALTQIHLATAETASLVNGGFYHPIGKHATPSHPMSGDENLKEKLWVETQKAIEMGRLKWM
ncbi:hypothetical protein THAOC_28024 [Thalassiosira oceanica]|uniref:NAD(P)-binding protein n=1 Tax=Thalassiosira oceanica TaxID=159749 RepID=K0RK94_THAOC|nr:hypothetical protein THAOC_28024 [Thalassiosira oceanica]|mmetsp:Transcript_707/g.1658  ORF Transcript_707/g.1658 Transcript_707/m.1658 type:complete len:381 (+) Transcript_707:157-1299(+)|eukprot:EJK52674.1 hypothetical protein THAOC_28024 [Thalassiosira oceanica]